MTKQLLIAAAAASMLIFGLAQMFYTDTPAVAPEPPVLAEEAPEAVSAPKPRTVAKPRPVAEKKPSGWWARMKYNARKAKARREAPGPTYTRNYNK